MSVLEYLDLVGPDFDHFEIQRRREKHRGYERLKNDIIAGALLPPITLAYDPTCVGPLQALFDAHETEQLLALLAQPGKTSILDGLQRTHILQDLRSADTQFKAGQNLLVEFWLEENPHNLIYRIIVLNAGQKPMSLRHQIEVLFTTFKALLETDVPRLELLTEKEKTRRVAPRKYALENVVMAYQAYTMRQTELQKDNLVAQQLIEERILAEDERSLIRDFEGFKAYLNKYASLDDQICRVYDGSTDLRAPTGLAWFGNENVFKGFFAAVGDFNLKPDREERTNRALDALLATLSVAQPGEDPLGLEGYQDVVGGLNPKKSNVGFATRRLIFDSFREFFRAEGDKAIAELWADEAS